MQFERNMGNTDRIARFVIGALLVVLALTGTIGAWGWLGLILIGTAAINFCPAYRLIGMNTCSR
jgi:O-antigen ligase